MTAKELLVVGGPNGDGKTTIALEYSAQRGRLFLSADAIAKHMSPDDPAKARLAAGVEFIRQLNAAVNDNESLIIESTLSGLTLQRRIRDAKKKGFTITIVFVYLMTPILALSESKNDFRREDMVFQNTKFAGVLGVALSLSGTNTVRWQTIGC